MQDQWTGRKIRALRHRLGWRQEDLAAASGTTQDDVSRVERGRIDSMPLRKVRSIADELDAEVIVTIRWRGGDLDRLIDEGHAAIGGWFAQFIAQFGWELKPEVTFSVYGERGSIDLLAWHAPTRTLLVVEIKTALVSVEETLRRHDAKQRLAAELASDRFGWVPLAVASILVLPDDSTSRRRVSRHDGLLQRAYPMRSHALRRWLRTPRGPMSGLLFASSTPGARGIQARGSRKRVRGRTGAARAPIRRQKLSMVRT